jgi:hypothetical protein
MNEAPLPEASPSASSFKKPLVDEKTPEKKRRGSLDLLKKKASKNREQQQQRDQQEQQTKKKVTFARTAKVKKVRSRQHYSEEEHSAMWYSIDEYTAIKKRCVQTLRLMMSTPNFQDDINHTSRGLESRTKDAAKKRKEFKMYSRELVLEEQENQREAGVNSPGRLREAYLEASTTASQTAQYFAKRDEEEKVQDSLKYIMKLLKFEYGWR